MILNRPAEAIRQRWKETLSKTCGFVRKYYGVDDDVDGNDDDGDGNDDCYGASVANLPTEDMVEKSGIDSSGSISSSSYIQVDSSQDNHDVNSTDNVSTNEDDDIALTTPDKSSSLTSRLSIMNSRSQSLSSDNNTAKNNNNNNNNNNVKSKSSTNHYYIDRNGSRSCNTILELHGRIFSSDEDAFNGFYTYIPEIFVDSDDDD